ncbi:hypothetical protein HPB51_003724 [Rhipicephalus microplus]|uniref:Uncharacterized protein n=1 Tax=Rhipicephalus microplus TaxID=6941 RepID=A0A9J6EKU1_RHIMP|nr:hypothetical protein HPB51_003724 [Rhipicephalus microplus]
MDQDLDIIAVQETKVESVDATESLLQRFTGRYTASGSVCSYAGTRRIPCHPTSPMPRSNSQRADEPQGIREWPYTTASEAGLIDTHCHLDYVFTRTGHTKSFTHFHLANRNTFPYCYNGARGYTDVVERYLARTLGDSSVVALGEIGLDYSISGNDTVPDWKEFKRTQEVAFRRQLVLARRRRLPLVIHSRDATADTIRILKEMVPADQPIHRPAAPIHRHCFTGNWDEAKHWLDTFPRLCLGITPLVGFSGVDPLVEATQRIPLDRLLLETDAPFFLPKRESGRLACSHPGMVIHVATKVAAIRDISVDVLISAVRDNTRRVYGI